MKKYTKILFLLLVSVCLLLAACSDSDKSIDSTKSKDKTSKTTETAKATGGEKLISVRAEYSYCYSTPENHDPTMSFECTEEITYKECMEWKERKPGEANTFFYAVFEGGEPTLPGRFANEYYMKVKYGDGLEMQTDTRAAHPGLESEFYILELVKECYPNGTIEIYNTDDKLMASMSFDYSDE